MVKTDNLLVCAGNLLDIFRPMIKMQRRSSAELTERAWARTGRNMWQAIDAYDNTQQGNDDV